MVTFLWPVVNVQTKLVASRLGYDYFWYQVHETASSVTGEMTFAGSSAHFISDDEL